MRSRTLSKTLTLLVLSPLLTVIGTTLLQCVASASGQSASSIPAEDPRAILQPADLVRLLKLPKSERPLILNVGPRLLYAQAHVPGAEYLASGSAPQYATALRVRVKDLPHERSIVLYCGCCPWNRCPNIHPALSQLQSLGFTKVKMMYIADNFGADWVEKGYPTEKGE